MRPNSQIWNSTHCFHRKKRQRQNGVGNSRLLYRLNVVTCLLHDIFFAHWKHTQPLEKGHFLNNKDQIEGSSRQDFFRQNIGCDKIAQNSIERICFVLKVKRQAFALSCFYSMTFGLWAHRACLELSTMAKKLSNLFNLTWDHRERKKSSFWGF